MKKLMRLVTIPLIIMILFGCGKKTDSTKIDYWTPFTGPDGTYMQNIIDDFNEENDDITVEMQVIPSDQYYEKIRTAFRSGEGPQVAAVHADQIPSLVQSDVLSKMDEFTSNVGMSEADFVEEAWGAGVYKNNRYSIPLDVHPLVMYVNNDIVDELNLTIPTTYDELIENGKKVVDESDNYGFALPTIWPTNLVYRTALLQNGMDVISDDGTTSTVDNPEAIEVAQLIENTWEKYEIAPENLERDGHIDLFKQGKVAFTIDGLWMSEGMNEAEINYTVAPLETLFGDEKAVWANSHQLSVLNDLNEEQTENAEKFISYLSEHSIEWAKGGQVPANLSVIESDEFKELEIPYIASQQMSYAKLAPQYDAFIDIWSPIESKLSEAYLGQITIEEALKEAAEEGNEKAGETLEQIGE